LVRPLSSPRLCASAVHFSESVFEIGGEARFSLRAMRRLLVLFLAAFLSATAFADLPFATVFKGRPQFDRVVAAGDQFKALPLGDRIATIGKFLTGIPYKSYTLEIDDRIEAPSVNLTGLDCWTFFEVSLAFARMFEEPREQWTPQRMLQLIEMDRYRGGRCDAGYLSRLHYLEDWLWDNEKRGLIKDLTRELGGVRGVNAAREMTVGWRGYRYMVKNPELRAGIALMEARVARTPFYYIPKANVAAIEGKLRNGDIIGICSKDGNKVATSHVGLAYRTHDGVLHFMHASSPKNYGKVVLDDRLSTYLSKFRTHAGIIVGRPQR